MVFILKHRPYYCDVTALSSIHQNHVATLTAV